jgi:tryptophanyl-tRNA synthetase
MAADITLYKANVVPVGVDQASHLEFTREIVRTFNHHFGPVLVEPQAKYTEVPKVLGIDGVNKMSKSLDNHIELASEPDELAARVRMMVTDPQRQRRSDPGRPEVCNVFSLHKIFTPQATVQQIDVDCRTAGIGCVDCKKILARNLADHLAPFRERRAQLARDPNTVWDVLDEGARRARAVASQVIAEVKTAVGLP